MPSTAPKLILDTNVVLDWLVFGNPVGAAIEAAVAAGRVQWLATPAMRAEFERVLVYPAVAAWTPDRARIDAAFARCMAAAEAAPAPAALRCTDADDQKFVDLALAERAAWLLTRDRALLRLARRLRAYGTAVLVPEAYAVGEPRESRT